MAATAATAARTRQITGGNRAVALWPSRARVA
jgi:hypothetical protein